MTANEKTGKAVAICLAIWLVLALLVGQAHLLQQLPPPAVPGMIFGLTALLLLVFLKNATLRRWLLALDVRVLVLLHVTRLVGIYFLVLYARGELPYDFAVKGGWGDIFVAVTALFVVLLPRTPQRRALPVWNILGLLDILFVVTSGARLIVQQPGSLQALTVLPLSLLPTFLVPLIIASHIAIFVKLRAGNRLPAR